jgi:hypothetical protein
MLMALLVQGGPHTSAGLALQLLGDAPTAEETEMVANALAEFSSLNFIERVVV